MFYRGDIGVFTDLPLPVHIRDAAGPCAIAVKKIAIFGMRWQSNFALTASFIGGIKLCDDSRLANRRINLHFIGMILRVHFQSMLHGGGLHSSRACRAASWPSGEAIHAFTSALARASASGDMSIKEVACIVPVDMTKARIECVVFIYHLPNTRACTTVKSSKMFSIRATRLRACGRSEPKVPSSGA